MIKTLAASIRDYMKPTIATPLLVLCEVACEMAIPFVTANLIDTIKTGASVEQILPTAGILVLLALVSLFFGAAAGITCSHASCGFAKNLRHDLFYKIQTFSFANIDAFSSSSLVTRLTTDVTNVQQAFMLIIRIAVRAPLVLIFAFVMAYAMGGSISFVYLAMIPLLGFGLGLIIHKVGPIFTRVFHKYDALNESVEENVTGMRVVKSYVREDYEKQKFAVAAQDVCADFTRAEKLLAFNNPMMNLCVNGAFVLIIYLGSKLIITSQATAFDVGPALLHVYVRLPDPDEPHAALHDLCHGHHGGGKRAPHQRGLACNSHHRQPRPARHPGCRRLHRFRRRELQILQECRAPGP